MITSCSNPWHYNVPGFPGVRLSHYSFFRGPFWASPTSSFSAPAHWWCRLGRTLSQQTLQVEKHKETCRENTTGKGETILTPTEKPEEEGILETQWIPERAGKLSSSWTPHLCPCSQPPSLNIWLSPYCSPTNPEVLKLSQSRRNWGHCQFISEDVVCTA